MSASKKAVGGKHTKEVGLLTSVAESIGSTIGTFVGSANAAKKAMTKDDGERGVKRRGKRLVRKSKTARHRTNKTQR
jgi:hypothetical protein